MTTTASLVDAECVLVIDLGSVHTRAALFDVVDGRYHFIASSTTTSTINAPFRDAGESVHRAFDRLQEITGRRLVDADARLIVPAQPDGSGVDRLAVTYSAGPHLRIITAGLLGEVSLESARRLVASTYGSVVESVGLNDRRKAEVQLDAVLQSKPDLVILTGGTDGGAGRSVMKMVELVALACRLLPHDSRPEVIYAGNNMLVKKVREALEKWTTVSIAPNLRPSMDTENLGPAREVLNQVITQVRYRHIGGLQTLTSTSSTPPEPTAHAFGRMVRFISLANDPRRAVLGIDLGASSTTIASATGGRLRLNVLRLGMGESLRQVVRQSEIREISRWLAVPMPEDALRDALYQKSLHPESLPMDADSLAVEQAAARQALNLAFTQTRARFDDLGVSFEPILACGGVLTGTSTPGQSLLMLLDGLQPVGVTTFFLDQHHLAASLGVTAHFNSLLPVHSLETGVLLNLGTVISPVTSARYGTPILRARLEYEDGREVRAEIRAGSIVTLPVKTNQSARLHLATMHRTEIDPHGHTGAGSFKIIGGVCGAVIDARGRPISLPPDDARRRDLLRKWSQALGGH